MEMRRDAELRTIAHNSWPALNMDWKLCGLASTYAFLPAWVDYSQVSCLVVTKSSRSL